MGVDIQMQTMILLRSNLPERRKGKIQNWLQRLQAQRGACKQGHVRKSCSHVLSLMETFPPSVALVCGASSSFSSPIPSECDGKSKRE